MTLPEPYYADAQVMLYLGDCRDILAAMEPASVDSIVTDPPYDLTSGKRGGSGEASLNPDSPAGRSRIGTGGGFMGQAWDSTGVAFDPETWRACLRVLKPGGHLLAFGGTRTYHRLACAIEDAGFEIRDSLHWIYAQGFPKSLDVSKAIDKAAGAERVVTGSGPFASRRPRADHASQGVTFADDGYVRPAGHALTAPATPDAARWSGYGTALKPAHEPIVLARKPLSGTVAQTVLEHGTGALNTDGCRVGTGGQLRWERPRDMGYSGGSDAGHVAAMSATEGRWPPNILLSEEAAEEMDRQSGVTTSPPVGSIARTTGGNTIGTFAHPGREPSPNGHGDSGGASRFFPVFRYEAKAGTDERPKGDEGTGHPTVKPLALMRWLIRLVTPPGGLVLDPFAGSGTTGEAATIEGFRAVLVEKHAPYADLIVRRLDKPIQPVLFGEAS